MKIAIVDDSKSFLNLFKTLLNNLGYKHIYTFSNENKLIKFLKENEIDVIFIDYLLKTTTGIEVAKEIKNITKEAILVMLTSSKAKEIKQKALETGIDEFLNKDIDFIELKAKLRMFEKLVELKNKEKQKNILLQKILEYKDYQENITKLKHKKLIKNELSNFFEDNYNIETYYKPKDILNGDTLFSIYINKHEYILGIIDAMGKGLSAFLTAINSVSFLEYAIKKAVEYNDFNFYRLINDFYNYAKSILLEEEVLCAIIVYIKEDELYYANFGMFPIYTDTQKILSNNQPISKKTTSIKIDKIPLPSKFYILSDGLVEAPLKNENKPYYARFIKIYKNSYLKNLITDFEANANQNDDISIIHFFKDNFTLLFAKEYTISNSKDIDKILKEFFSLEISQKNKIHYILHELLTNTLEHALYKIEDKKNKEFIKQMEPSSKIKLKISLYKNENFIKILFEEESEGFDPKILDEINCKYHGRGYKIIKSLCDVLLFNKNANKVKILIRNKNEN